ncbi:MAG TPA: hypothetical protein VLF68_00100 [Candidatus Saccharimonadales bacterium]|nr:hypothetical protein [Candidatus Saccharimonadales bacterium]
MSKIIIVAVVVLLVLGGGYMFLKNSKSAPASSTTATSTSGNSGGVFGSIKDALSKSVSLQCDFTDETGRKTVSYIKNGAIRADVTGQTAQENGSVIMKDNKMWVWNGQTGFMMDLSSADKGNAGQNQAVSQQEEVMNSLEKYKSSCKPAVVADSLFATPSNVKFQDMSQMMKGVPTGMPSGMPSGTSQQQQQQMQQYLQQYQNSGAGQ